MSAILCIDTSNTFLSIACKHGEKSEFYLSKNPNCQTEEITFMIDEVLEKLDLNISQIENFGINIGPGSFTGVRIGIGYLTGILAFKRHAFVTQVDTFDIAFLDFKARNIDIYTQKKAIAVVFKADATGGIFIKKYSQNQSQEEILYLDSRKTDELDCEISASDLIISDENILPNLEHKNKYAANKNAPKSLLLACLNAQHAAQRYSQIGVLKPKYLRQPF